jgi:hypothetical protein
MQVLIRLVYEPASRGFCSILEIQVLAIEGGRPISIGVRNYISSLEKTLSGSYGIKPFCIFFIIIKAKKVLRNTQRNSNLVI